MQPGLVHKHLLVRAEVIPTFKDREMLDNEMKINKNIDMNIL